MKRLKLNILNNTYKDRKIRELEEKIEKTNEMCDAMYNQIYRMTSMLENIQANSCIPKRICPICHKELEYFEPYGRIKRGEAQCPVCKSLERHRALWLWLHERGCLDKWNTIDMQVLHFAPERKFADLYKEIWGDGYWPVDINPDMPGIRKRVDITNIPFDDNRFDLIMCNHVLEHIQDEAKALSEMRRVLKPNGEIYLMVPLYNIANTIENPEYNTPELREEHYGQADHVRKYGQDFSERLLSSGFDVDIVWLEEGRNKSELIKYGLKRHGRTMLFICRKNKANINY